MSSRADAELDTILASDGDERVRALLAARIARLLSTSNLAVQGEWAEHIDRTLRALAADEAVRVRAAVADELAQTLAAPRDLVLQLAHDASREVSDRVIRLSPLLSDGDLLSILACAPCASVAASIANRDHLSAVVADAIAIRRMHRLFRRCSPTSPPVSARPLLTLWLGGPRSISIGMLRWCDGRI